MGSVRSSSTTYSSGGLFRPTRRNSMYSSAETAVAGSGMTTPIGISFSSTQVTKDGNSIGTVSYSNHKMSFYDRLVGRRSTHGNKLRPGLVDKIICFTRGSEDISDCNDKSVYVLYFLVHFFLHILF